MTDGKPAPERLTFSRSGGGHLQIAPSPLATMLQHIQDEPWKPEVGGVLLGRHILDSQDIVVDWVTTPQLADRQTRLHFFRARRRHQQLIDAAWQESGGTCTYLGEWHTHPESCPTPSVLDQLEWYRKLIADYFSDPIFFLIVGTVETRAWEGRWHHRVTGLQRA